MEEKKIYKLSEKALTNKRNYTKKWQKEHNKVFTFQLNVEKDRDIINYLSAQKNRNKFIKEVLKEAIFFKNTKFIN